MTLKKRIERYIYTFTQVAQSGVESAKRLQPMAEIISKADISNSSAKNGLLSAWNRTTNNKMTNALSTLPMQEAFVNLAKFVKAKSGLSLNDYLSSNAIKVPPTFANLSAIFGEPLGAENIMACPSATFQDTTEYAKSADYAESANHAPSDCPSEENNGSEDGDDGEEPASPPTPLVAHQSGSTITITFSDSLQSFSNSGLGFSVETSGHISLTITAAAASGANVTVTVGSGTAAFVSYNATTANNVIKRSSDSVAAVSFSDLVVTPYGPIGIGIDYWDTSEIDIVFDLAVATATISNPSGFTIRQSNELYAVDELTGDGTTRVILTVGDSLGADVGDDVLIYDGSLTTTFKGTNGSAVRAFELTP